MAGIKSKWKRAPMDQRRVSSDRTIPHARFTRSQRSGSLPPSLPNRSGGRSGRPIWMYVGALLLFAAVSILLVIGIGTLINAKQQYDELQWRASYYGRPTLPYSTLAPNIEQQIDQEGLSTSLPLLVTPLPGVTEAIQSASSDEAALTEPNSAITGDKLLSSYCPKFGVPVSMQLFDWNDWSTIKLDNPLVAQLPITWDASTNFWRGYQYADPYDKPADEHNRWRLSLYTADESERWMDIGESATTPDTLYVLAFQNLSPFADSQGKHYGIHPCRAFTVPATDMNILLSSAGAYQSSGSQFPAFAAADDPRWVQGNATPISGSFDLRSIPTIENNQPIKTVEQAVSCFFITDVNWGDWAQIKLGDTTAWVDTTTVRLDAS